MINEQFTAASYLSGHFGYGSERFLQSIVRSLWAAVGENVFHR